MSIGSKFALVALILPICLILAVLAIAYSVYPNPFLLALVAALPSATVFIWRELRSTLRERMHQVWDTYLKPIRDGVLPFYFFPDTRGDLGAKIIWVAKYGKYGRLKLYPGKLVKENLVTDLLTAGEDFNSKFNGLSGTTNDTLKSEGLHLEPYFAFDRWEFRKIPPDELKRQDASMVNAQKIVLDYLERNKNQEVIDLTLSWKKAIGLSNQIVAALDEFSSQNGIMPKNPVGLMGYGFPTHAISHVNRLAKWTH